MIIKSNIKIKFEKFINLENGQIFSLHNDDNEEEKIVKCYFIKMDSSTIPNKPEPYDTMAHYGYAVDLENGQFIAIKNDKMVVLENGYLMVED